MKFFVKRILPFILILNLLFSSLLSVFISDRKCGVAKASSYELTVAFEGRTFNFDKFPEPFKIKIKEGCKFYIYAKSKVSDTVNADLSFRVYFGQRDLLWAHDNGLTFAGIGFPNREFLYYKQPFKVYFYDVSADSSGVYNVWSDLQSADSKTWTNEYRYDLLNTDCVYASSDSGTGEIGNGDAVEIEASEDGFSCDFTLVPNAVPADITYQAVGNTRNRLYYNFFCSDGITHSVYVYDFRDYVKKVYKIYKDKLNGRPLNFKLVIENSAGDFSSCDEAVFYIFIYDSLDNVFVGADKITYSIRDKSAIEDIIMASCFSLTRDIKKDVYRHKFYTTYHDWAHWSERIGDILTNHNFVTLLDGQYPVAYKTKPRPNVTSGSAVSDNITNNTIVNDREPVGDEDDGFNWFTTILKLVKIIANAIKGIVSVISDVLKAIRSLVTDLVEALSTLFETLFVPRADFFNTNFTNMKNKFSQVFGFADYTALLSGIKENATAATSKDLTKVNDEVSKKGKVSKQSKNEELTGQKGNYALTVSKGVWIDANFLNFSVWDADIYKIHIFLRFFFYPLIVYAQIHFWIYLIRGSSHFSNSGESASKKGGK